MFSNLLFFTLNVETFLQHLVGGFGSEEFEIYESLKVYRMCELNGALLVEKNDLLWHEERL